MKKLLIFILSIIPIFGFSQKRFIQNHMQYTIIDSLSLERISIHSPFDYESDKVIPMGDGDYLIEIPHKDKMVICYNKDKSKAIILYNSYCFGRHKEFNVTDNEKRTLLWYKDDHLYCGYIYDKVYKVAKYFESR